MKVQALRDQLATYTGPSSVGLFGPGGAEIAALFTPTLIGLHWTSEAYAARVALGLLLDLGLEEELRAGTTVDALCARYSEQTRAPLAWMLPFLAEEELLLREGQCYRLEGPVALGLEELRAFAEEIAPGQGVNLDLLDAVRRQMRPFFTEGRPGEKLLFDLTLYPMWLAFFSNSNLIYALNNHLPLAALKEDLPEGARVLELGGGAGSFAKLLTEHAGPEGWLGRIADYRFTDVAPTFLRKAQRELPASCPGLPLSFSSFDLNKDFGAQGLEDGSFDAVIGINVIHVARQLPQCLEALRRLLKPGGRLIVGECLKPDLDHTLYLEFLFNFLQGFTDVECDPVLRPRHGFLTPELWHAALEHAGFSEIREVPPVRPLMESVPSFNVGAFAARR